MKDREDFIWNIDNAQIRGYEKDGVRYAIGVRYAHSNRFGRPSVVSYSNEIIDASGDKAPRCPQTDYEIDMIKEPQFVEDCQYLNIVLPAKESLEKLPVMVWIHGGSYNSGAGDLGMYIPTLLAKEGIVVVSVNYRLGFFGYSSHANLGLLDQMAAIEWTNRYISYFGGDPENVTLFGQSAGGDAVYHLIMAESDNSKLLFKNVIIQSAPFGVMKDRKKTDALIDSIMEDVDETTSIRDILGLENVLMNEIKRGGLFSGYTDSKHMTFGVRYGEYPLPKREDIDSVLSKRLKGLNVIVGSTTRETSFSLADKRLKKLAGIPVARLFLEWMIKRLTKRIFNDGAERFYNFSKKYAKSSYLYLFDFGKKENLFRSCHCGELPLIFDPYYYKKSMFAQGYSVEELDKFGVGFRKIWSGFAKNGSVDIDGIEGVVKFVR